MNPILFQAIHDATPDWLPALVTSAASTAVLGGIFGVVQLIANKKLRSPADRLAEVDFYVKLAQSQVSEAKADKKSLEDTLATLRTYVDKLELDGRSDQDLIRKLYRQIQALEARMAHKDGLIQQKQATIDRIAQKLAASIPITLADLGADLAPTVGQIDLDDPLSTDTGETPVLAGR